MNLSQEMLWCSDYDSSINNLIQTWVGWMNHTQGLEYKVSDVTSYDWVVDVGEKHNFDAFSFFREDGFPYTLNEEWACVPFDDSVDFINRLKDITDGRMVILTATHDDMLIPQKNKHISFYFGEDTKVIHEKNKSLYATTIEGGKNGVIDDNPHIAMAWALSGGEAILYTGEGHYTYALAPKYAHPNLTVCDTYEEILFTIEKKMALSTYPVVLSRLENEATKPNQDVYRFDIFSPKGEEVGFMTFSHSKDKNFVHVENIKIDEKLRNRGLGTKLFSALAENEVFSESAVCLDVLYEKPISFYKRLGFIMDSPDSMSCDSPKDILENFIEKSENKYKVVPPKNISSSPVKKSKKVSSMKP